MSPRLRRLIRLGGSVAILAVVILMLPAGSLRSALTGVSPAALALAVAVFVSGHVVAALKWRMLMGPAAGVSPFAAIRAHYAGLVGTLSPLGFIGGDVVRAGVAIGGSGNAATVTLTSVVDRLVDLAALVVLATVGALWLGREVASAGIVLAAAAGLVVLGGAGLAAAWLVLERVGGGRLSSIRDALRLLARRPGTLAVAHILSVAVQGSFVAANAYLGATVGVETPLGAWLMAWPGAKLTAYLPISVAGIGVRETALIALLRPFGGAPGPVMAAGLLWDAVLVAGSLGGWLVLQVVTSFRPLTARRAQPL
jgi:hypothetical protein